MAQERLSTGTIDDTAEFDSIMSRNFSADEAAAFDDMPIFADQAIEEDSYSLAYTRGERVSVIAASDTYVTSPDINNVYAERKTGSERASLTRKIGTEATIASMTMGDRGRLGQWIDKKRTSALERFADNEHDSLIRKLGKKALRGTIEHAPTIVPAAALGGMLLTAYMGYRGMNVPQVTRTPEAHETELLVQSTVLAAGGRGDGNGDFIAQWLHESGQANGSEVMTTQYPAQIGPIDPVRMDTSLSIGANDMYNDYLRSNGEEVRIVGYSEGTGVAVETANRIAAENGGSLPSNVKVVLFAPPYAEGGLFDSSMIRAGSPMMNAMGIDTNMPIPPGTEVHYWDTDVYANGGDQQTMASRFRQALSLGAGGHDPLDQSKAAEIYRFTDSQGVVHVVGKREHDVFVQQALDSGMYIADPWAFDRAIQALAPISMDPNVRLEPNVRLALQEAALGIDKQIDPSGNTHIVREFVEKMPEEWKELGQSGMDAFNGISEAATLMAEGKLDPMTGMNQIMGHINGVMGDFSASIPNPDAGYTPIRDWGANSAIGIADNYNVDIRPIVDNIQQQMQNQAPRGTAEVHQNVNVNVNPLPPQQESYAPPAQQPAHEFGARIKNLFENLAPQAPATPAPTPPIPAPTAPVAEQLNIPTTPIHVEVTPPATPAPVVTGPIPAPTFPEVKVGNGQAARDVQTMIENGMDVLNSSLANAR